MENVNIDTGQSCIPYPEEASALYQDLTDALRLAPDFTNVYNAFNNIFLRCLDQKTKPTHLLFGGVFAKTDYLLKEYKADQKLSKEINTTRSRLRRHGAEPLEELRNNYLHDFMHICKFIALLYNVSPPLSVISLFPSEPEKPSARRLLGDSLRISITHWDSTFVYGNSEESSDNLKINYAKENTAYPYDWSYLETLFFEGAQLNIIRPREEDGVIYPELIIFEPDYLVNITSIARCFSIYADSHLVDLINKFTPQANSEAIILGNFASQMLDETLHHSELKYKESVSKFFKDNAISMLGTSIGNKFHDDAKEQKKNIDKALNQTLPHDVSSFDSREGIVEPSFFSEMLGLQGRMDFLQMDFKVLLEQKSGKGKFPYNNFIIPTQTQEHYIQLLLYMTLLRYNYHSRYVANNNELNAFLLYSKYQESLLSLGFAPELVFKALQIRNRIAYAELQYVKPNGFSLLDELTPEKLNEKHADGKIWTDFIQPQLSAILNPIHAASDLERAYFYRLLTFVANEHMLSKIGDNKGFASSWLCSLDEKLQSGNIYHNLSLTYPDNDTKGQIDTVSLKFDETAENYMTNFRIGDIVILYPYTIGTEPDACQTMVFRCTITDLRPDSISLKLRAPQSDNRVFLKEQGKLWAIEHDFIEASFNSLYKGMHSFLTAPKERRDLILTQRRPAIDSGLRLKGEYESLNEMMLHLKQAKDLFLIIGPPGTGKTSHGLLYAVEEELKEDGSSILLMAYTNRAIDEICCNLKNAGIDFIRLGSSANCPKDYSDHLLGEKVAGCKSLKEVTDIVASARVVVGTTTSVNSNPGLFKVKQFTLAVIDEASQILEPHLVGLLSACHDGTPAIKKFVLIGDYRQLPAVVLQPREISKVDDNLLQQINLTDCRLSLFERLLKSYEEDPEVTYHLCYQGRMHPAIADFPSEEFYHGKLKAIPLAHQLASLPEISEKSNGIARTLGGNRLIFIATDDTATSLSDKTNQTEADIISATINNIYKNEKDNFDPSFTVGVIVPYRNQIATIRNSLKRYDIPQLLDITIDTVERFQGSQRKIIIYGFTIKKHYQLNFLTENVFIDSQGCRIDRKLNVAMTRAREHLIIVGNPRLLSYDPTFSALMQYVRDHGCYIDN